MDNILITGASGFIGSHICLILLEKGFNICAFDSFINSSPKALENVLAILKENRINAESQMQIVEGDLTNKEDIDKTFERFLKLNKPIKGVIHLAGLKSVHESVIDPLSYWENNVVGSINLFQVMKKYKCKTIVFSSSATVYETTQKKIKEDQKLKAINPYGNSKLAIERILNDIYLSDSLNWRIACLRYFNPIGAHSSGLIGEDPKSKVNNIYPKITKVALGDIDEISIFGSDWPTKDGTGVRDYIHVMDLAEGHLSALNYLINQKTQLLNLNLGTALGTSVLELIHTFQKVNNVNVPYSFKDRRSGDNAIVIADNSLAKSILNWEPKRNLEDMCRDGWKWQLKNPTGFT